MSKTQNWRISLSLPKKLIQISGMLLVCLATFSVFASNCSIQAGSFNFGNYNPLSHRPVRSMAPITLQDCIGKMVTIHINSGINANNTNFRKMKNANYPNEFLDYYLYQDAANQKLWGNTPNDSLRLKITSSLVTQNIYGLIPGGQDVGVGTFIDNLEVTIDFDGQN